MKYLKKWEKVSYTDIFFARRKKNPAFINLVIFSFPRYWMSTTSTFPLSHKISCLRFRILPESVCYVSSFGLCVRVSLLVTLPG